VPAFKAHRDLEFEQVEKYVARAPALLLPPGWRDWPKGHPPLKHKLPIDDELPRLSSGRKKILSAGEVRIRHSKIYWPSHEIAIRLQLTWYAKAEFQDSIAYAANEAPLARRRFDHLSSIDKSLDEYFSLTPRDTEVRSAAELVRTAKARVSSELRAIRSPQGGKPAQNWKAWFVVRLAGFWHIITGEQPSSSPDGVFAELVSAAWNSLHSNIPEIKWDTFVRRFAGSANLDELLRTAVIASICAHRLWQL
jgi:hypothetical protein